MAVPPPELAYLVMGNFDLESFLSGGLELKECIEKLLRKNDIEIKKLHRILDLGCGCGRVMRHWASLKGPELYGTDINQKLIEWCLENIPFGNFSINKTHPPLHYDKGFFGFVYLISIFTHLNEEMQREWLNDLERVIMPGGFLLISFQGSSFIENLNEDERNRFESGEMVIKCAQYNTKNSCGVYHPYAYVKKLVTPSFEIIYFSEKAANGQDAYLMRRIDSTEPIDSLD